MYDNMSLYELKKQIETDTGFKCYEGMYGEQMVWYGLSANYTAFKNMIGDYAQTGTIVYIIDTNENHTYSKFTNTWY